MRSIFIAGNWKMYKTPSEAAELAAGLADAIGDPSPVKVAICPPFTALLSVIEALKGSNIAVGAQNMHPEQEGAFTGEISAAMLLNLGVKYVIIGHSERRHVFGETDEFINAKVRAAFGAGLYPILCVGEKLDERESGKTFEVVKSQLAAGLKGYPVEGRERLTIAYEPVWAIGTGKVATPDQAREVHSYIRGLFREYWDEDSAEALTIQYGGSVKSDNARGLIDMSDIDGFLVGGASLKVDSFREIVAAAKAACS